MSRTMRAVRGHGGGASQAYAAVVVVFGLWLQPAVARGAAAVPQACYTALSGQLVAGEGAMTIEACRQPTTCCNLRWDVAGQSGCDYSVKARHHHLGCPVPNLDKTALEPGLGCLLSTCRSAVGVLRTLGTLRSEYPTAAAVARLRSRGSRHRGRVGHCHDALLCAGQQLTRACAPGVRKLQRCRRQPEYAEGRRLCALLHGPGK